MHATEKYQGLCDTDEVKEMISVAKNTGDKRLWKQAHRARRRARREWEQKRLADILHGDWHQYRAVQREKSR